jgi:hypothetical protein
MFSKIIHYIYSKKVDVNMRIQYNRSKSIDEESNLSNHNILTSFLKDQSIYIFFYSMDVFLIFIILTISFSKIIY